MGKTTLHGDDAYRTFEFKIARGLVPDYDDFLRLKEVIDKHNHEKAKWLLGLLGIQQDSEKLILPTAKFEEAQNILKGMSHSSDRSFATLDLAQSRRGQENTLHEQCSETASEQNTEDSELAINFPLKKSTKLNRSVKKIPGYLKTLKKKSDN